MSHIKLPWNQTLQNILRHCGIVLSMSIHLPSRRWAISSYSTEHCLEMGLSPASQPHKTSCFSNRLNSICKKQAPGRRSCNRQARFPQVIFRLHTDPHFGAGSKCGFERDGKRRRYVSFTIHNPVDFCRRTPTTSCQTGLAQTHLRHVNV